MARRTASGRLSAGAPADRGYALAALLVGLAVMGIAMSAALPVWSQAARRERELELIFRGEQYARAIGLYQRVYAGAYPPDIDTLVEQRFLRRRYRDPMVADGEFRIVYQAEASELLGDAAPAAALDDPGGAAGPGAARRPPGFAARAATPPAASDRALAAGLRGGVAGVASRSAEGSLRIYNGATRYNAWVFVHAPAAAAPRRPAADEFEAAPRPGRVGTPQRLGPARPLRADRPR